MKKLEETNELTQMVNQTMIHQSIESLLREIQFYKSSRYISSTNRYEAHQSIAEFERVLSQFTNQLNELTGNAGKWEVRE